MLLCPLCCGQEFEDTAVLAAHLSTVYQRLKCPLCSTRFDNLMVMTKHLEHGDCISSAQEAFTVKR